MINLWFDGLFRRVKTEQLPLCQAGFMCYGWVITENGCFMAHGHGGFAGLSNANSNVAEYLALIEGLDALLDFIGPGKKVQVYGDAKSVIEQMRGVAEINAPVIRPLHQRAAQLARNFYRVDWIWKPRRENHAADALTRKALRQMRLDREQYQNVLQVMIKNPNPNKSPKMNWQNLLDLRIYGSGNRVPAYY